MTLGNLKTYLFGEKMHLTISAMFKSYIVFIAGCLSIAALQVGLHCAMLGNGIGSGTLVAFYTYKNPANGKGESDIFDIVLPSILFGLLIVFAGKLWSTKQQLFILLAGSLGIICLLPVYTLILGERVVWWWPKTESLALLFSLLEFPKVILLSGVSVCWLRLLLISP